MSLERGPEIYRKYGTLLVPEEKVLRLIRLLVGLVD